MLLSGQEIKRRQKEDLLIEPFSEERLNPNGYNLALHHELLIYEEVVLDAAARTGTGESISRPRG